MTQIKQIMVAVAPETAMQQKEASELAKRLHLPLSAVSLNDYRFLLVATRDRLELRQTGDKAPGPVFVDFTSGAALYRKRFGGGRKQAIARAAGLKGNISPTVFDATAGLGKDAFVLAGLGCRVHLFERSPIIGALLEDGLRRAQADPETGPLVKKRMSLVIGESRNLFEKLSEVKPEVVYLDPMYPHRTKSALVKKEMRMLRAIVGEDEDAPILLKAALAFAQKRVVVKRPKSAPPIAGPGPTLTVESKNSRFDVYLIN